MPDKWEDKGGTGRWKEYVNSETGESSLKIHKLRTVWQSCPKGECYFILTDSGKRECTCSKCGSIKRFILGMQNLVDGEIVFMR